MSDTKMLQIVLDKITKLQVTMDKGFRDVNGRIDEVVERLDKFGLRLAALEDDAPTLEDHEKLVVRVDKLEEKVASI